MNSASYKLLSGIASIHQNYGAFLIDLWGVIHDGNVLYPHALEALWHLKAHDKSVVFVSNSPRRASKMEALLTKLGVARNLYVDIITSGELLCNHLENKKVTYGENYYFFGPEDRHSGFEDIPMYKRVSVLEDANFIIAVHFSLHYPTLAASQPFLKKALDLNLPMICANPDKISVLQDGTEMMCVGSVAASYEAMGGQVLYYGKPYEAIYEAAKKLFPRDTLSCQRILAIGDGIETDIKGAVHMKIDSCLVAKGIPSSYVSFDLKTGIPTPESLTSFLSPYIFAPSYVIPFFAWKD